MAEFLGIATPSSLSGEAYRVIKLNVSGISKTTALNSVIIDRMAGLISMVILVVVLLPFFGIDILRNISLQSNRLYFSTAIIIVLFVSAITVFVLIQKKTIGELMSQTLFPVWHNLSFIALTLFLSFIGHFCFTGAYYVLFREIIPIPFFTAATMVFTSQIARSIPISMIGIGLGDGTMIGLASLLGIETEGVLVVVMLALGSRYLCAICGLIIELAYDGKAFLKNLSFS